jgi:amino acid transporter
VADTFENLLGAVVFILLLSSTGSGLAHVVLRRKKPSIERPYRTWGYPLVPLLFVAAILLVAIQIFCPVPSGPLPVSRSRRRAYPFSLLSSQGDVRAVGALFPSEPGESKELKRRIEEVSGVTSFVLN